MSGDDPVRLLGTAAAVIGARLDDAFHAVEIVRRHVADVRARAGEYRRAPDRAMLTAIRPTVHELLPVRDSLLEALGVAVEPGALGDTDRWLEWWRRDAAGECHFIRHELNPDAVGFYDYQAREWFRAPIDRERPMAVGPYFDAGGTEVYTITLGVPLLGTGGDACLVGGDLSLPALEALFLSTLRTRRHPIVLVAASDRVIASNSARHVTGSMFRLRDGESVIASADVASADPRRLPWRLLRLARP